MTFMKTTIYKHNSLSSLKKKKGGVLWRNKRDGRRVPDEGLAIERLIFGIRVREVEFGSIETLAAALEVGIKTTTETFVPVLVD